jgi:hypothetical protein
MTKAKGNLMSITLVMGQQTQRWQQRTFKKYFYIFALLKMSLHVTIYKVPDGGLQAENIN